MKVRIENAYSDGHESTNVIELATEYEPDANDEASLDIFWDEHVYEHTGDGHGAGQDLGSCYTATITEAANTLLVGLANEWTD